MARYERKRKRGGKLMCCLGEAFRIGIGKVGEKTSPALAKRVKSERFALAKRAA